MLREPRFGWPDSDDGRAAVVAEYQRIIDEIDQRLSPLFGVRPAARVRVERIPAFKETTSPLAYYNPPALDGSRPGVFYANLRDVAEHARPRMAPWPATRRSPATTSRWPSRRSWRGCRSSAG